MLWAVVVVVVVVIIWTMIEMMKPVSNVREQKARGCKSADIWKVQRQSLLPPLRQDLPDLQPREVEVVNVVVCGVDDNLG